MCGSKKWLKSVYIYRSYRKIKTGVPLFGTQCVCIRMTLNRPYLLCKASAGVAALGLRLIIFVLVSRLCENDIEQIQSGRKS